MLSGYLNDEFGELVRCRVDVPGHRAENGRNIGTKRKNMVPGYLLGDTHAEVAEGSFPVA